MELVPNRQAATLLPIIQQHVNPRSIAHSDEWRAYTTVVALPNVASHGTVNHSITLILLILQATGVHTLHIES